MLSIIQQSSDVVLLQQMGLSEEEQLKLALELSIQGMEVKGTTFLSARNSESPSLSLLYTCMLLQTSGNMYMQHVECV